MENNNFNKTGFNTQTQGTNLSMNDKNLQQNTSSKNIFTSTAINSYNTTQASKETAQAPKKDMKSALLFEPRGSSNSTSKNTAIISSHITTNNEKNNDLHTVIKDKDTVAVTSVKAEVKATKSSSGYIGRVSAKLKKVKHIEFYIAALAIGIMLLIYFSSSIFASNKPNSSEKPMTYDDYIIKQERKLLDIVSSMRGVGEVSVAITFESSIEYILAVIKSESNGGKTESPILINDNGTTKPVIVKEIYPKALGVVVVAEGAGDSKTKTSILDAVSIMLDIARDKIVVTQRK